MDIATKARFAAAYTYKYSIRPGTPAGVMPNQVDEAIVGERYTRLHEHLQAISLSVNREAVGTTHRVLVNEVEGRRDSDRGRITGRSEDFRLVHFDSPDGVRPGDFVDVEIEEASAHYLLGRSKVLIPSRGGDAFAARIEAVNTSAQTSSKPAATMLGMPQVKPA
jgi:tRNA-2-methylthio-N6-dimethylallyladenosine synthase